QRLLVAEQLGQPLAHGAVVRSGRELVGALRDEPTVDALLELDMTISARRRGGERRSHAAAPLRLSRIPTRSSRPLAARASGSGSRVATTPASTERAISGLTGTRASTGTP